MVVYLSLYLYVFIICCWLWCCGYIPRWVLNHLLDLTWEIPLGGRNPISSRYLGIFCFFLYGVTHFQALPLSLFNLMSTLLFSSFPFPFYSLHFYFLFHIYIYIYKPFFNKPLQYFRTLLYCHLNSSTLFQHHLNFSTILYYHLNSSTLFQCHLNFYTLNFKLFTFNAI